MFNFYQVCYTRRPSERTKPSYAPGYIVNTLGEAHDCPSSHFCMAPISSNSLHLGSCARQALCISGNIHRTQKPRWCARGPCVHVKTLVLAHITHRTQMDSAIIYAHIFIYIYIYMYRCVLYLIFIYIYIYMYIYIHIAKSGA